MHLQKETDAAGQPAVFIHRFPSLFPQRNHCIAAPARTYDCQKVPFMDRKIYIG